jgi:hypothetical protein
VRQNNDMRRISAWAAIWAVPTLLVGIYGMNFRYMLELGCQFGYPLILVVMVVICLGLYRAFRRYGWLYLAKRQPLKHLATSTSTSDLTCCRHRRRAQSCLDNRRVGRRRAATHDRERTGHPLGEGPSSSLDVIDRPVERRLARYAMRPGDRSRQSDAKDPVNSLWSRCGLRQSTDFAVDQFLRQLPPRLRGFHKRQLLPELRPLRWCSSRRRPSW